MDAKLHITTIYCCPNCVHQSTISFDHIKGKSDEVYKGRLELPNYISVKQGIFRQSSTMECRKVWDEIAASIGCIITEVIIHDGTEGGE